MSHTRISGWITASIASFLVLALSSPAGARPPIRRAFFDLYPNAVDTQLDNLPSNSNHCGVCHFDFDGGGPRNPYGLAIQVGIDAGLSYTDAILAVQDEDSDNDGFSSLVEVTDEADFGNTPTFPGLSVTNYTQTSNVDLSDIEPYLTPSGGTDMTPPVVDVLSPDGGEVINAETYFAISFTATDESGIAYINVLMSDDSGATFRPVAKSQPPGGGYSWFVPNRPGTSTRIRVEAVDNAGNLGYADSDADFTIVARPPGYVPTTLRDMDMPGTQPLEGAILDDPDATCASCHGNYDPDVEPWYNWRGSMMAQSARDPFFYACMAVAEQDAPSVGDLCIRCHSPGGWQEGRSVDTSGDLLNVKDRHGVQCDFCHRMVDPFYVEGVSPPEDVDVLADISPLPLQYGNGQFINDPTPLKRGPYADADAAHAFVQSPLHQSAHLCGTCHDVSNPVFVRTGPQDYAPSDFDQEHPDVDVRDMFPVERTYSEWTQSEYASTGVYAPQFAGDKPDGIVSTCEDCHMRDVTGRGCSISGSPQRSDLGLHDLTGGNTFVPDIVGDFYPDEVDAGQLQDAKARATAMIQLAATLDVTPEDYGLSVRVTNETGHKLPSGYPEGRRIWIQVVAYDASDQPVFESGDYDFDTGELIHDDQIKVYAIHAGLSPGLAGALGLPAGESFHFVLNDSVYVDNRIPPRGFTNAAFEDVQSPVVGYTYADGQYWDDTEYQIPADAVTADVTLYYQTTSKEYIEFLRDANTTNSAGQDLYNAWVAQGKAPPVVMAQETSIALNIVPSDVDGDAQASRPLVTELQSIAPNPVGAATTIRYSLAERGRVSIGVHDVSGRLVRSLVNGTLDPGHHVVSWNGEDDAGHDLAPGVYFVRYQAGSQSFRKKVTVLE